MTKSHCSRRSYRSIKGRQIIDVIQTVHFYIGKAEGQANSPKNIGLTYVAYVSLTSPRPVLFVQNRAACSGRHLGFCEPVLAFCLYIPSRHVDEIAIVKEAVVLEFLFLIPQPVHLR